MPGRSEPIRSNRYVVAHGDEKSVVLYWYQSHNRVIASELAAKFWLVADSIKYHRSDSSLVRVVVPVRDGDTDIIGRLIKAKPEMLNAKDENGKTPVNIATEKGDTEMASFLRRHGGHE